MAAALITVGMASRATMVALLAALPPARPDGLGRAAAGISRARLLVALGLGIAVPLLWSAFSGEGLKGLMLVLVMALAALGVAIWARTRLGGQTGDVLGATQQITTVAGWVVVAAG